MSYLPLTAVALRRLGYIWQHHGILTAEVFIRAAAIVLVHAPEKDVPVDDVVVTAAKCVVG